MYNNNNRDVETRGHRILVAVTPVFGKVTSVYYNDAVSIYTCSNTRYSI